MDLSKMLFSHCSLTELIFKEDYNMQEENGVALSLDFTTDTETSESLKITGSLRMVNPETDMIFFAVTMEAYYNNSIGEKINVDEFSDEEKKELSIPIWNEATYLLSVLTKSAYKVPNIVDFAAVLQDLAFEKNNNE